LVCGVGGQPPAHGRWRPPKREGRASLPLYSIIADEDLDAIASPIVITIMWLAAVAIRHFPKAHILMTELSYT